MKVKVPKEIKIGAHTGRVGIKPYMKNDEGWKGAYSQRTNALDIDSQLEGEIRDRTFCHEVIHMVDLNYECGLNEENTSRIAHGILEFLQNNLGIELDWGDIE